MTSLQWRMALLLAVIGIASFEAMALSVGHVKGGRPFAVPRRSIGVASMTVEATDAVSTQPRSGGNASSSGACYYRRIDGPWRPRKELSRLVIGERLFASRLPGSDLLDGKTGPKAFLECGVGTRDSKGKWSIVNGMVRLGRKGMKASVVRKKIKKMPPDELLEVYVSKIRLEEGMLEVCLSRDEALDKGSKEERYPASSLEEGDLLYGRVTKVTNYGAFIDVGANRNGLIHISKVAKQQGKYIAKDEGLKKAGLSKGTRVTVIVVSNEKKRLELDIAPPEESEEDEDVSVSSSSAGTTDISDEEAAAWAAFAAGDSSADTDGIGVQDEEAAMWAAYAADPVASDDKSAAEQEAAMWAAYAANDGDSDEEEDDYDEDADIEDALGIGYY